VVHKFTESGRVSEPSRNNYKLIFLIQFYLSLILIGLPGFIFFDSWTFNKPRVPSSGGPLGMPMSGGNRVAAEPTSSRGMEELGVFIAFKGKTHFCPKPPVESFFLDSKVEGVHSKGVEVVFMGVQRMVLLQQVQKADQNAAIIFPEEGRGGSLRPSFAVETTLAKACGNLGSRVMSSRPSPGGTDEVFKTIVKPPRSIVPEVPAFGDEGGDGGNKGDVVGGIMSERGESRRGERGVRGMVNENMI
jgi:hypothetical protein